MKDQFFFIYIAGKMCTAKKERLPTAMLAENRRRDECLTAPGTCLVPTKPCGAHFHPVWFGGHQDAHPRAFAQASPPTQV
jgi:hypothetical protein